MQENIIYTLKRNKVLIHVVTWVKLKDMLHEINQSQKTTYYMNMIPLIRNVQN